MGRLTDKYRPSKFDEIVGQKHIIPVMKDVISNPDKYPKNFIFSGPWGTGKSTLCRSFANEIPNSHYYEYDVSIVGNVESMKDVKSMIDNVFTFSKDYRIVVFDEIQEASKKAQAVLLKTLEDNMDSKIFFIFATTEKSKIIDTIRSRCIEFDFHLISPDEMKEYLKAIISLEGITVPEVIQEKIIEKASGHMRDALNLLDKFLITKENFLQVIEDSTDHLYDYLFKNKENIAILLQYPSTILVKDLNFMMKKYVTENISKDYHNVVNLFELYMKYKNQITTLEDVVAVLSILKRFVFTTIKG